MKTKNSLELNGLSNIFCKLELMKMNSKIQEEDFKELRKMVFLFKDYILDFQNGSLDSDWGSYRRSKEGV